MRARLLLPILFAASFPTAAFAADDPSSKDASKDSSKESTDASSPDAKESTAGDAASADATKSSAKELPPAVDSTDPTEKPGQTYYFAGLRYRHTVLPAFILHLFASGGPTTVSIPAFGVEAGFRKDGFDIIGAITYVDYSMNTFPFKGKSEADTAWELVKSNIKLINFTADMLWSAQFGEKKNMAFQYGVTAGLGIVVGSLSRVQATPPGGGTAPGDPHTYVPCAGPGNPNALYCDNSNSHYGSYKEPSWFNGGSKPNLYPTFGPQLGFRYKPIKQLVARVDAGFNLFTGFFFGVGVSYGF